MAARKSLTREQLLSVVSQQRQRLDEIRRENRRIETVIQKVLGTRSQLRDEAADLVSEEIETLSKLIEEYQEFGTPEEIEREREAMLRALGIDVFEWERVKWKFL